MKNQVNENMAVFISYKMFGTKDGSEELLLEEVTAEHPEGFIFGIHTQFPALEDDIRGKEEGYNFNISVSKEDAYGNYDDNLVLDLKKEVFIMDGQFDSENVVPGRHLHFMTPDGTEVMGKILKIGLETVKVDFNNPLAGYDLRFEGRIEKIRPATQEELDHGHLHDPGHHHHG